MLVNPQFTNLMNGKRVLRITVFGFPARYSARPDLNTIPIRVRKLT